MSYCVHCGVELAQSERVCPLCGTEVCDPAHPDRRGTPPFPRAHAAEAPEVKTSGVFFILTLLFLLPLLLSLVCDLSISGRITWSGYVMGACAVVYFIIVPPCCSRQGPTIFLLLDYAAISAYLAFIEKQTGGSWFLPLCFPLLTVAALFVIAIVIYARHSRSSVLAISAISLFASGLFTLVAEWRINSVFELNARFTWSLYPLVACSVCAAMLVVIDRNEHLKEKLRRKLFI